jgi:mono/diheme cytochrome c family protein
MTYSHHSVPNGGNDEVCRKASGFKRRAGVFFGLGKQSSKWTIRCFASSLIAAMVLVLANGMVFAATDSGATDTAPGSARVRQGEALFQRNCVTCHNKLEGDRSPFGPPNLHGIFRGSKPAMTPRQAAEIIQKGRTPMPSFESVLTPAQINTVIVYLKAQ